MRTKFAMLVTGLALGIAALAPAAQAVTFYDSEGPLPNGTTIHFYNSSEPSFHFYDWNPEADLQCDSLRFDAKLAYNKVGSITMQTKDSEVWGCNFHWDSQEIPLAVELKPSYIYLEEGNGSLNEALIELNMHLGGQKSGEISCSLTGQHYMSWTDETDELEWVPGFIEDGEFTSCLGAGYSQFNLTMMSENGPVSIK